MNIKKVKPFLYKCKIYLSEKNKSKFFWFKLGVVGIWGIVLFLALDYHNEKELLRWDSRRSIPIDIKYGVDANIKGSVDANVNGSVDTYEQNTRFY